MGYKNTSVVKRKMVYNFYKLWETKKMLKLLKDIVETWEDGISIDKNEVNSGDNVTK